MQENKLKINLASLMMEWQETRELAESVRLTIEETRKEEGQLNEEEEFVLSEISNLTDDGPDFNVDDEVSESELNYYRTYLHSIQTNLMDQGFDVFPGGIGLKISIDGQTMTVSPVNENALSSLSDAQIFYLKEKMMSRNITEIIPEDIFDRMNA